MDSTEKQVSSTPNENIYIIIVAKFQEWFRWVEKAARHFEVTSRKQDSLREVHTDLE